MDPRRTGTGSTPGSSARTGRRSRRDELLDVAAHLFAERGFPGVTVDDIGAACGISGPALYHHFDGKEALLGEMLVSISGNLLTGARTIVDAAGPPDDALRSLVRFHAAFAVDHPELIVVQTRDLVHATPEAQRSVRRLQRSYVELWVGVIRELAPQTDLRAARAAVQATFGLLNSTPHSGGLPRPQMASLLAALALRALDLRAHDAES